MTSKQAYKQLLTVAVLSATMGSTAFAVDTQAGYVPAMGSQTDAAPVQTVSSVPNTSALPAQTDSGKITTTNAQPATDAEAIAAARGSVVPASTSETADNKAANTAVVSNAELTTKDKDVLTVARGEGSAVADDEKAQTEVTTAPVEAQYVSAVTDAQLQPFVGRTISGIRVEPVDDAHQSMYLNLMKEKIGDTLTIEGVKADIAALGNTGIFSEVTPVLTMVPEGVKIEYRVTANPVVREVNFIGNTVYTTDELRKYMDLTPDQVLNSVVVGQKVQGINAAYNRDGYILAHVGGINVDNSGTLTVGITEGIVEDIIVRGNKKTKDYVIKREMNQKVGKPFNKFLVRRSVEKIYNTGYFEDVNIRLLPGTDPSKVIIEIDVLEQRTGTVTLGAGYSKSDGFIGIVELGENNFRGTGDKIKIHWEFGGTGGYKNYQISYTRPWIDSKGTSLGFTIFDRQQKYTDYNSKGDNISEYDQRRRGFNVSMGRQTGEYTRDYVTVGTEKSEWKYDEDDMSGYRYDLGSSYAGNKGYDFAGRDYIGKNFGRTNSITWAKVYDSRDNVYDPTRGQRMSFTSQWAGHGLGGDFDFLKFTAEGRAYRKVGHAQVLAFRARLGWAFGDVPYSALFTAGGADTLRGYEDDQFRGRKSYNATLEYRFPLVRKVSGVVFTDVGGAWDAPNVFWYSDDKKFNASVGAGLRVSTPIGPIRLDYGVGSDGGKFHFSFGGQF